ncbi:MAG: DoxX family protein, partial [Spirulinaceae cyanobacterium]
KVRIGAILLIIFLIPATLVFHNPAVPGEINNFLKNLALIGGLLMTIYAGAGALSLDSQTHSSY